MNWLAWSKNVENSHCNNLSFAPRVEVCEPSISHCSHAPTTLQYDRTEKGSNTTQQKRKASILLKEQDIWLNNNISTPNSYVFFKQMASLKRAAFLCLRILRSKVPIL